MQVLLVGRTEHHADLLVESSMSSMLISLRAISPEPSSLHAVAPSDTPGLRHTRKAPIMHVM
ncbi:hypothetical protein DEO23_10970 [Brachybacterium endophyticum]|uniref:Uncharacterized protein n=1 Tax=Brachybacterium endophyticum TaxID=2182385 RepID=A0A2U2RIW1_9MICO|nr:hypothetical protein DEO23_10970 [Brachybacterium endophyticum]